MVLERPASPHPGANEEQAEVPVTGGSVGGGPGSVWGVPRWDARGTFGHVSDSDEVTGSQLSSDLTLRRVPTRVGEAGAVPHPRRPAFQTSPALTRSVSWQVRVK